MFIHVYDFIYMYVHGTYMFMNVPHMYEHGMNMVQRRMYIVTATLHLSSGPIGLATPVSLSSAQAPLLQSCLLPFISLL